MEIYLFLLIFLFTLTFLLLIYNPLHYNIRSLTINITFHPCKLIEYRCEIPEKKRVFNDFIVQFNCMQALISFYLLSINIDKT